MGNQAVIAGWTMLRCVIPCVFPCSPESTSSCIQHDNNATQVPPEWHSWIHHIRKDAPTEDRIVQNLTPPWKTVCFCFIQRLLRLSLFALALGGEPHRYPWCLPVL